MTPNMVPVVEARGTVLLFGGCYSNLQATSAFLDGAPGLRISTERTVIIGEVAAYGADPAAGVDLVRSSIGSFRRKPRCHARP